MIKGAHTATVQTADTRKVWNIERDMLPPELEWVDNEALWSNLLKGRYKSQNKNMARLFVRFIRALVAVIVSHRHHPEFHESSDPMIEEWERARNSSPDGRVPMGAIINSLRHCGSVPFMHALYAMMWAGHLGTYSSLTMLRFVVTCTVKVYFSRTHSRKRQTDESYVRPLSSCHLHC